MAALDGLANDEVRRRSSPTAQGGRPTWRVSVRLGQILRWAEGAIAIHTDFGPAEQDKDTNQDLCWLGLPDEQESPSGIVWALAMADGVTASYQAELGAELACRASLARLLAHPGHSGREGSRCGECGRRCNRRCCGCDHGRSRAVPAGWNVCVDLEIYAPRRTSAANHAHLGVAGRRSSAIWPSSEMAERRFNSATGPRDERNVLAAPNVETSRVHAIGPGNRHVDDLDCLADRSLRKTCRCWRSTRTVSAMALEPTPVCYSSNSRSDPDISQGPNVAEQLIQEWIRTRADDFDDNLSLAIVSWD